MLALDKGVPRELTLKEMLERFRDHRLEVIRRRSRTTSRRRAEAHIIEGLLIALEYIDEVIAIIRASKDQDEAASRAAATRSTCRRSRRSAILAMRLGRLTALETTT
jgi:DNA gyrase subunit A